MPKTLLPMNESTILKQKDIAYRSAIPKSSNYVDYNPKTCAAKLLPFLAKTYLSPWWDELWSEKVKREWIVNLPLLHKRMGTVWSIRKALEITGLSTEENPAVIKEGLNGIFADGQYLADGLIYASVEGSKFRFRYMIFLSIAITTNRAKRARQLIESFAPVQTFLVALVFKNTLEANGLKIANGKYNAGAIGVQNV